jgi:hypothetical protein
MNNHDMIARAMVGYAGEAASTSQIRNIVLSSFPTFNPGSLLPNSQLGEQKLLLVRWDRQRNFLTQSEEGSICSL